MKTFRVGLIIIAMLMPAVLMSGCSAKTEDLGKIQYVRKEAKDNTYIYSKIDEIDISKMSVDDVIELLGEPDKYYWEHMIYDYSVLPERFLMEYEDILNIHIKNGKIIELQIFGNGYTLKNKYRVGMTTDELKTYAYYKSEIVDERCTFKHKAIYSNINGKEGRGYYDDGNWRVHIYNGKVKSIYIINPEVDMEEEYFSKLMGGFENEILWVDIKGMPFLTDNRVLGKWMCIDYIKDPDKYDPALTFNTDLMYSYIEFLDKRVEVTLNPEYSKLQLEDYALNGDLAWSRGYVFNQKRKTASKYFVMSYDGTKYLFLQDRGWEYSLYGRAPQYHIFTQLTN